MSFKKKLLIVLTVVLVVCLCVGVSVGVAEGDGDSDGSSGESSQSFYNFEVEGAKVTVNKTNLNLTIEKDGRIWYSGNRNEDDGLSAGNRARVTDAVTVTYRNISSTTGGDTTNALTRVNNSSVRFTEKGNGFDARIKLGSPVSITFTLQVRFDGTTLKATIPFDSIEEDSDSYRLKEIQLYPYFDSSYGLVEGGQIFIPDGSGALIDLSTQNSAKSAYSARIYGEDYGIASTNSVKANAPERVTMPVLATLYPDGGTMAVATSGAEYANVNAAVAGITNNYNRTYFTFLYREEYVMSYESAAGIKSQRSFTEDINQFDAEVTYTLLSEGSDVVDVATTYRDNFLNLTKSKIDNVGLRLQFLMAENKQGMFGRETVNMTSTEFVEKVAKEVVSYCDNLTVSLTGYQKGGLGGASPSIFPLSNNSNYRQLAEEMAKIYVQLNFVADYVRVHDRASMSNYNLAQNLSEQFIVIPDVRAGSEATYSLLRPSYTDKLLEKDLKKLEKFNDAGIEFQTLGSLLFSGFKQEVFTRSELIERQVASVKNAGVYASLSNPNDYMFGVLSSYVDIPLTDSAFLIETESVPFVQMVLSGYVSMYSQALNLDYTGQDLVLRLIDSNVYPSFILTEEDAIELYGTDSQSIFTSSFDIWKYSVKETYEQVNAVLQEVVGCVVVARQAVANNVYVTTYSNGVNVVVNYSSSTYTFNDVQVAAQTAAAIK